MEVEKVKESGVFGKVVRELEIFLKNGRRYWK